MNENEKLIISDEELEIKKSEYEGNTCFLLYFKNFDQNLLLNEEDFKKYYSDTKYYEAAYPLETEE